MRHTVVAALLGLSLATPAAAQTPNVQKLLGGILGGNQNQDQSSHDAYQRGRQDEARQPSYNNDRSGGRQYDHSRNQGDNGDRNGGRHYDRSRNQGYNQDQGGRRQYDGSRDQGYNGSGDRGYNRRDSSSSVNGRDSNPDYSR